MITFIIITYNNSEQIRMCIESVFLNCTSWKFNILVIDNKSTDSTAEVLGKINDEKMIFLQNNENIGFAAAVNQGLKYAMENVKDAGYFFLLNPDAFLEKDCLENLISEFEKNGKLGLASPIIINPDSQKTWFSGAKIAWLRQKTVHAQQATSYRLQATCLPAGKTSYLSGCALMIKKSALEKVGHFDEKFFLYYEDADFSLRVKKSGFGLKIISQAICYHRESQSSTSEIKNYHLVKSGLLFFHKHYPRWALPWFWLVFWIRFLYHSFVSRKKVVLNAMRDFNNYKQRIK